MTDKTEAQPEALRLAAEFEDCVRIDAIPSINDVKKSAAELRRQHAEIQQLKAQLITQTNRAATAEQEVTALNQRLDMANRLNTDARNQLAQLSARQAAPDEHVAFETWAENHYPDIDLEREADGYRHSLAQEWWDAWRASGMLSAAPPPPEREPLTDEQIDDIFRAMYGCEPDASGEFSDVCRRVESAHGIGATND